MLDYIIVGGQEEDSLLSDTHHSILFRVSLVDFLHHICQQEFSIFWWKYRHTEWGTQKWSFSCQSSLRDAGTRKQ